MSDKLVNINLHGQLGEAVGRKEWRLSVKSVAEACRAIDALSKRQWTKHLLTAEASKVRYKILINGKSPMCEKEPSTKDPASLANSELVIPIHNLDTIDIVPVLEGAGDALGFMMIVVGVLLIMTGVGAAAGATILGMSAGTAIMAGAALAIAGVTALSMKPPAFVDDAEIAMDAGSGGARSYLFNGPANTAREGGPVPIGYGRLVVGSQIIQSSNKIRDVHTASAGAIDREGFSPASTRQGDTVPTLMYQRRQSKGIYL
jgi:predicted phage tail protein